MVESNFGEENKIILGLQEYLPAVNAILKGETSVISRKENGEIYFGLEIRRGKQVFSILRPYVKNSFNEYAIKEDCWYLINNENQKVYGKYKNIGEAIGVIKSDYIN